MISFERKPRFDEPEYATPGNPAANTPSAAYYLCNLNNRYNLLTVNGVKKTDTAMNNDTSLSVIIILFMIIPPYLVQLSCPPTSIAIA